MSEITTVAQACEALRSAITYPARVRRARLVVRLQVAAVAIAVLASTYAVLFSL